MPLQSQGLAVEEYARRLAGSLGVPDFVYRPPVVRKGSGTRELGDGLLVAGGLGLIVQVKSRSAEQGHRDGLERAERWCRKHAEIAQGQGLGTRNRLAKGGVTAVSLRGHAQVLPSAANWPIVVVIDHPLVPSILLGASADTLYLAMRDWLGLHTMIRSTHGLIEYVRRALGSGLTVPLGQESTRYAELARADALWAEESPTSVPLLPSTPLRGEDLFAAQLYSELVDKVADPTAIGWDSQQYLRIVERLDRKPTLARVKLGRRMIARFEEMVHEREARGFLSMDKDSGERFCVLYDYDLSERADLSDRRFDRLLLAYTTLRHLQAMESGADPVAGTLGVGVIHHPRDGRRYSFVLIEDQAPPLPPDLRSYLEERFGIFNGSGMVPTASA